ncbi:MAG TPA: SGNH/GDSL hydrolase family protein [Vicinamibacteria bacterium]|nr:SGNH/GDSL hydrolase family protein [Vicinamibacteria bacterium]
MKRHALRLATLLAVLCGCGDRGNLLSPELTSAPATTAGTQISGDDLSQLAEDFPFKKILCFGDSITLGITLEAPLGIHADLSLVEGYVPKLWRRLEARYGTGLELINAGIGGERTTEGVERIRFEMRTHNPDLVLLLEGVVDVNNPAPRFPVVRENLATMMELVHRQGKAIIVGTYPRLNPDGFRTNGWENVPRLNDVIRQEANRQGVPIADHERATPGDLSGQGPDGLHPNDIGYEAIADSWFEAIVLLVEGPT